MFGDNPSAKWIWLLVGLVAANLGYYFYNNWGLVTVKVDNVPVSQVIRSIEWQGWVKIYSNLPPDSKVTMYVDHVPLAEAMETLAVNVDVPPPPDGDDNTRPRRDRLAGPDGQPSTNAAPIPAGQAPSTNAPPSPPQVADGTQAGANQGGPGGRGGGGFNRGAQWNLAFFAAPTEAGVKQEIREFQSSDPNDDNKVYTFNTQMQLVSTESTTTAADPWQQSWSGEIPVNKPPDPTATNSATTNAAPAPPAAGQPDPNTPPTVHTYFQALAQSANIWIMAPGSWTTPASVPPKNSSIVSAVKNLVSSAHGYVTQAIVLRAGRGGAPGRGSFAGNDDAWADRMRNAINGLPPDERPEALDQLNQEIDFRKSLQTLPPEQRRDKFIAHSLERMLYGERLARMSPIKRAQAYQRLIANRTAAKAK